MSGNSRYSYDLDLLILIEVLLISLLGTVDMSFYISTDFILIKSHTEYLTSDYRRDNVYRLLDMRDGMVHYIDEFKTMRKTKAFKEKKGVGWKVLGETNIWRTDNEMEKYLQYDCLKVYEDKHIDYGHSFFNEDPITTLIYLQCEISEIHDYVKNPSFLSFLPIYRVNNEYPTYPFIMKMAMSDKFEESGMITMRQVDSIKLDSVPAHFFEDLLSVPE